MIKIERSLSIALATNSETTTPREVVVTPITARESLVAARGLGLHLQILYKGVLKKATPDRALLAVYDFIGENVEEIRQNSANLMHALDLTREDYANNRMSTAMAISHLKVGEHSHRTGVWLKGKASERRLRDTYDEIAGYDNVEFYEYAEWARKRAANNSIYWRQQLENIRENEVVIQLRDAIEESDHSLVGEYN